VDPNLHVQVQWFILMTFNDVSRLEPEFAKYVDGIVKEAEKLTNDAVPTATKLVDSVVSEAQDRVMAQQEFPYSSFDTFREAKEVAIELIEELLAEAIRIVLKDEQSPSTEDIFTLDLDQESSAEDIFTVYPVRMGGNEAAMKRILKDKTLKGLKGKGKGKTGRKKKKSVTSTSTVSKVDSRGDAKSSTTEQLPAVATATLFTPAPINRPTFWKYMVKKKLSPRPKLIASAPRIRSQRLRQYSFFILPSRSHTTAPPFPARLTVEAPSKKKGLKKVRPQTDPSPNPIPPNPTTAKDIWNEIKLLRGANNQRIQRPRELDL